MAPPPALQTCRVAPRPVKDVPQCQPMSPSFPTTCELAMERLGAMLKLESTTYKAKDYYQQCDDVVVSRCLTVEYMYQIVDYGGFQRDVVTYAMTHLLDRYLSTQQQQTGRAILSDLNHYQLVSLTCLYMAVKLLEPNNIGVESLVPLTHHIYSVQQFVAMESHILHALGWRVAHGPTPLAFVQHLLQLLPNRKLAAALYPHIQYQLELAVSDYDLCSCCPCATLPSHVAVAAIWNALEAIDVSVFALADKTRYQQTVRKVLGRWEEPRMIQLQSTLRELMLAAYTWSISSGPTSSSGTTTEKDTNQTRPSDTATSSSECDTTTTTSQTSSTVNGRNCGKKHTPLILDGQSTSASRLSRAEGKENHPETRPSTNKKSTSSRVITNSRPIQHKEPQTLNLGKQHPTKKQGESQPQHKSETRDTSPSPESISYVSQVEWFLFAW